MSDVDRLLLALAAGLVVTPVWGPRATYAGVDNAVVERAFFDGLVWWLGRLWGRHLTLTASGRQRVAELRGETT